VGQGHRKTTSGFFGAPAPRLLFVDFPVYLCFILTAKAEYNTIAKMPNE